MKEKFVDEEEKEIELQLTSIKRSINLDTRTSKGKINRYCILTIVEALSPRNHEGDIIAFFPIKTALTIYKKYKI